MSTLVPIYHPKYPNIGKYYMINEDGQIYSKRYKKYRKTFIRNGYEIVGLTVKKDNLDKNFRIHRLIAFAFIPNADPINRKHVNHKDGNRTNNHVSNLEWVSRKENAQHAIKVLGKKRSGVPVMQIDPETDEVINIFNSVKEAEEKVGASNKHISTVCYGKRGTTGGYKWKFVNDVRCPVPEGKSFAEYPNYIITKEGRIYTLGQMKFMKPNPQETGYLTIGLSNNGKKDYYIHDLVAALYIPNPEGKTQVNHKDRNKSNNHVDNLEWVTPSENMKHAIATKHLVKNNKN